MIKVLNAKDSEFKDRFETILSRGAYDNERIENTVKGILKTVKAGGDKALFEFSERFDGVRPESLHVTNEEIKRAKEFVSKEFKELYDALSLSAKRIESFHRMHLPESWDTDDEEGILLGQKITPLRRAGIYVPGGKALYPSSILMNAIPARVAGVDEIVMVTPPSKGGIDPALLAAAYIADVDSIYQVGGAQSVAALAYGTETIPRVDKIVGPGNIYVATAKRLVYGIVDIDMIAGPSEITIVNDGNGDAAYIAADLLSQAEHDEMALCVLLTTSGKMAEEVRKEVLKRLEGLKRKDIASKALRSRGAIILVDNIEEAVELANEIAPEHLELFVEKPVDLLKSIKNAGAVFLGAYTPESIGDYLAGPNHVLPTGGTARFSSPLGTQDFLKRSSIISFSCTALKRFSRQAMTIAEKEGLQAHAKAIEVRISH